MADKTKTKTKIKMKGGGDKVREERAKLTASYISSLGIGVIVIGAARPLLDPSIKDSAEASVVAISMVIGGLLHLVGRAVLRQMREPEARPKEQKEQRDDE